MERFIHAVGAGARRARALTRDEAREAMELVAAGRAAPEQVGALLLALRMKGETPEELAGFVDALAATVSAAGAPPLPPGALEVDAHGDGHGDRPSLLLASACAAAAMGTPICLSLSRGSRFARHGLDEALGALGLEGPLDAARAAALVDATGVGATDLALACPPLHHLVSLRPLFGLRTAAQTAAKLVSAFAPPARLRLVGVFHAPYLGSTAKALGLLGVERGLAVQALGGLPEPRPGRVVRVADAGEGEPRSVDLRDLADPSDGDDHPATATEATLGALAGTEPHATRAAVTAALLVHAATGAAPRPAADAALAVLRDGRARRVADRLRAA